VMLCVPASVFRGRPGRENQSVRSCADRESNGAPDRGWMPARSYCQWIA